MIPSLASSRSTKCLGRAVARWVPELPETKFELGFRTTIDKETQESVLQKVYELTFHINPKIWLGIKWLCTYISIRPGEFVRLKEKHIDLGNGYLIIPIFLNDFNRIILG